MDRSTGSAMNPSSGVLPFLVPTQEETNKYMQHLIDSPLNQRIHSNLYANPANFGILAAKFQMMAGEFGVIMQQQCAKLEREKADLEKLLSSVTMKLNQEIQEVREESGFLRFKNEQLHVENERLRELIDGFAARENAIKNAASRPSTPW